jgi:hypothetical protein
VAKPKKDICVLMLRLKQVNNIIVNNIITFKLNNFKNNNLEEHTNNSEMFVYLAMISPRPTLDKTPANPTRSRKATAPLNILPTEIVQKWL